MKSKYTLFWFLFLISCIALWIVMYILPRHTSPGYCIVCNTTSELGAQHTKNAWIMNLVFAALGISAVLSGSYLLKQKDKLSFGLLAGFGLSLIGVAIFHHKPVDPDVEYLKWMDDLHSIFATTTGIFFTSFALISVLKTKQILFKILACLAFLISIIASVLMANAGKHFIIDVPNYSGIYQRVMFFCTFGWMLIHFLFNRLIHIPSE
ncbi:MAG: DUF998 domain-containing protein [Bacteroidetes bacterium]|nr:DUF998 domain-containing protein [Bacteroidota bacterium]